MVLIQARLILTPLTLALLILPFASLALLILSLILLSIIFLSPRSARPFFYIQKLPINRRAADVKTPTGYLLQRDAVEYWVPCWTRMLLSTGRCVGDGCC